MIWLTSDTHFGHGNVIKYSKRPFASENELLSGTILPESVSKMNETIIKNWNEVVKAEDTVLHLGDFSMSAKSAEDIIKRLNGKITLILGNHDIPHPSHPKSKTEELRAKRRSEYLIYGFSDMCQESIFPVPGVCSFRLNHFPYEDSLDLDKDGKLRLGKYRMPDDGVPLLCGHVHEKWLFKRTKKGTPMLNVGIDAPNAPWSGLYRPASLQEVIKIYRECIGS